MSKDEINALGVMLSAVRAEIGDDYLIVSIGARGSNLDMPEGNVVATVRNGPDEATAEAKFLFDAINLAKDKIERDRAARQKKEDKA